jgi:hypothetical protein
MNKPKLKLMHKENKNAKNLFRMIRTNTTRKIYDKSKAK